MVTRARGRLRSVGVLVLLVVVGAVGRLRAPGFGPAVVEAAGYAAIFVGVWWIHPAAAMIAAGVGALLWARGAQAPPPPKERDR